MPRGEPMKTCIRTVLVASLSLSLVSAPNAQSPGFSAADSKELASYRLTMATTKKVYALMRSVMQEMASDPKFQALQKTKAEIDALSKKEELTDAESERLEKLQVLRSEEHTSELQSPCNLVCRLLLEKKKKKEAQ